MTDEKKRNRWFIVTIIFLSVYLIWRIFFTLPWREGVLQAAIGIALAAAETVTSLGVMELMVNRMKSSGHELPLPDVSADRFPDVDVFIATHNESAKLLYKTINAALTQPVPQPNDAPQITAPAQSASTYTPTPENMGVKKPQNSQGSGNGDSQEETDPQEETSTEETAAEPEGSLPASQDDHAEDSELLDTVQVTQAQENPTTIIVLVASAALLILVLILIAVLLTLKKR